jgi:hypothetical protein
VCNGLERGVGDAVVGVATSDVLDIDELAELVAAFCDLLFLDITGSLMKIH